MPITAGVDRPGGDDSLASQLSISGDAFISQADASRDLLQFATESDERKFNFDPRENLSKDQIQSLHKGMTAIAEAIEKAAKAAEAGESEATTVEFGSEDPAVERAMWRVIFRALHQVRMPPRGLLMRRAVLLLAVIDFELLVGEVMRAILMDTPRVSDASISLAELESIGDVAEAKQVIINRKIDDLLRKNIDDWAAWFERIDVKWKDMTDDWSRFSEIFSRRNVVVHAGATVTEQYLSGLRSAGWNKAALPSVGDKLELDDAYLQESSEQLLSFGVLLVGGTWLQLRKGETLKAESWIKTRTEQLLELEHFAAVSTICATVLSRARGRLRRDNELALKTMSWVARRELGDVEEVQKEAREWDSSGINLRYAHAKAVLLEQDDKAVAQISTLMERGDLTVVELCASPLYRRLIEKRRADLLPDVAANRPLSIVPSDLEVVGSETDDDDQTTELEGGDGDNAELGADN
jgi:hypothetical protein